MRPTERPGCKSLIVRSPMRPPVCANRRTFCLGSGRRNRRVSTIGVLRSTRGPMMKLNFGYASLGLLVGALAGLSSSPVANALLAGLFAFAGGGVAFAV